MPLKTGGRRQFAKRLKRSMRQVHRAGEKLFIDYAGPTIALVVNGQEVGRANIFVSAMGISGYLWHKKQERDSYRKRHEQSDREVFNCANKLGKSIRSWCWSHLRY